MQLSKQYSCMVLFLVYYHTARRKGETTRSRSRSRGRRTDVERVLLAAIFTIPRPPLDCTHTDI